MRRRPYPYPLFRRSDGGIIYPAAVLAAGAQAGWNAQYINPASSPANLAEPYTNTAVNGTQGGLPTGWKYGALADVGNIAAYVGAIVNTANGATLDSWDTNGRPILLKNFSSPTVNGNRIRNRTAYNYPGIGIGTLGSAITGPITITNNDIDGEGEQGGICRFTGSITAGILDVTSIDFGDIRVGMRVDTGLVADVSINTFGTGGTTGTGGLGTYSLVNSSQTLASRVFCTRPYMGSPISEHATTYHSGLLIQGNKTQGAGDIEINSEGARIFDNHCRVGGWNAPLAHWDVVQVQNVRGDGSAIPIEIRRNFFDATPGVPGVSPSAATAGRSYGRTSTCLSSGAPSGIIYSHNIFGGAGAQLLDVGGAPNFYAGYLNFGTNGREFLNNVWEWGSAVVSPTAIADFMVWSNNYRLSTGGLIAEPVKNRFEWKREDNAYWVREDTFPHFMEL